MFRTYFDTFHSSLKCIHNLLFWYLLIYLPR
jgi:hypothetical protein